MEDPAKEIRGVVLQITTASSPDQQKKAIEAYMTPDVGFRHPICAVESAPESRKTVLGIYQWYRILSPYTVLRVDNVVWDKENNTVLLDIVQWFKLFFLPIQAAPARLLTRLTLRKEGDLYFIATQEDFYHPEDFFALLLPPLTPLIQLFLLITGFISSLYAKFSHFLGYWRPSDMDSEKLSPDGPEDDLYTNTGRR
ncbi:hypothetical protein AGABI1DRAFT_131388 [Agaricus bisporus var. burnettii JB137-S8]|nr:uncharacterized protein AGABI1DRAFT_131388 [Agaricus bisporus var. burnettii JB137-S8]EKM76296.1 hypothetical protein AGABI1DRAFT_131388 [Agaricus bisporus var. burnettii JB137-S8]